jgi:4-hydroxy-3-methylbut-2-enyl diphosphate reductase IspH
MKISAAKRPGYCFSNKRVVRFTFDLAKEDKNGISIYGPQKHNSRVFEGFQHLKTRAGIIVQTIRPFAIFQRIVLQLTSSAREVKKFIIRSATLLLRDKRHRETCLKSRFYYNSG